MLASGHFQKRVAAVKFGVQPCRRHFTPVKLCQACSACGCTCHGSTALPVASSPGAIGCVVWQCGTATRSHVLSRATVALPRNRSCQCGVRTEHARAGHAVACAAAVAAMVAARHRHDRECGGAAPPHLQPTSNVTMACCNRRGHTPRRAAQGGGPAAGPGWGSGRMKYDVITVICPPMQLSRTHCFTYDIV